MNNQSPPTQQLAEFLARKCANDIDTFVMNAPKTENQDEAIALLAKEVLQSIPLVELLTCAKELQDLAQDLEINTTALSNLNTKLTQLLGEQTE